jgi:hypothetical protein
MSVKSSAQLDSIHYVVIGRTGVLISDTKYLSEKTDDFELKFPATTWMVPEANLLVYYIHFTGEILYDSFTLKFAESLPNTVRILIVSHSRFSF